MLILHFFGFGNSLRQFELEQFTGLSVTGFRPLVLDEILKWSQSVADQKKWNRQDMNAMILKSWMKQAAEIHRWQNMLRTMPDDIDLVAGIGDRREWQHHWESMLRQQGFDRD